VTTLAQLRKTALSFPETAEEGIGGRMVAFTVRDKRFASTDQDGCVLLHLREQDVDKVLAEHPTAERLTRGATTLGVRVPFKDINGQQLNQWVSRAWRLRAPKRLAEQAAAADTAAAGKVGDLPEAIGRPATAALVSAGITTLAHVAGRTEAQLLEMHGIGPKAVRILNEALNESR
jgi:hypothetical protein